MLDNWILGARIMNWSLKFRFRHCDWRKAGEAKNSWWR